MPAVAGLTVSDATGTFETVIVAIPPFPSLVAVIVAVPAVTPVTSPAADTVATDVALVAHVTTRPDSGLPAESVGVAASCSVRPTARLAVAGLAGTAAAPTSSPPVPPRAALQPPLWM